MAMTDASDEDVEHNVSIPAAPALAPATASGEGKPRSPTAATRTASHTEPAKTSHHADTALTPWADGALATVVHDGTALVAALRERDEELLRCRLELQSSVSRGLELEGRSQVAEEEAMRWHLTLMQERERQRAAASTLAQEVMTLESDLDPLRRERDALRQTVQQLEAALAECRAEHDKTQQTCHELQTRHSVNERARRQAEAEVGRLRGEMERWTRTCQDTAREQVRLESANLKLQAQLAAVRSRLQRAECPPTVTPEEDVRVTVRELRAELSAQQAALLQARDAAAAAETAWEDDVVAVTALLARGVGIDVAAAQGRTAVLQKLREVAMSAVAALDRTGREDEATVRTWQSRCRVAQDEVTALQAQLANVTRQQHSRAEDDAVRDATLDEVLRKSETLVQNALREHGKLRENGSVNSSVSSSVSTSQIGRGRFARVASSKKNDGALDEDGRVSLARSIYAALLVLLDAARGLRVAHRGLQQKHAQHVAQSASAALLAQKRLAEVEAQLARQLHTGGAAVQRAKETQAQCAHDIEVLRADAARRVAAAESETKSALEKHAAVVQRLAAADAELRELRLRLAERDDAVAELRAAETRVRDDAALARRAAQEWHEGMQSAMRTAESHAAQSVIAVRHAEALYGGLTQCVRLLMGCMVRHHELLAVQHALLTHAESEHRARCTLVTLLRGLRVTAEGDVVTAACETTVPSLERETCRGVHVWRVVLYVVAAVGRMRRRMQHRQRLSPHESDHGTTQPLCDLLAMPLAHTYGRQLRRRVLPCVALPSLGELADALCAAAEVDDREKGNVLRCVLASVRVATQGEPNGYCDVMRLSSELARRVFGTLRNTPDVDAAAQHLHRLLTNAHQTHLALRSRNAQLTDALSESGAQNAQLTALLRREEAGRRAIKDDIDSLERELRARPDHAELERLRDGVQEAMQALGRERAERRALEERVAKLQRNEADLLATQLQLRNETRSLNLELARARYTTQPALPLQAVDEDAFAPVPLHSTRTSHTTLAVPHVESLMRSTEEEPHGEIQNKFATPTRPAPLSHSAKTTPSRPDSAGRPPMSGGRHHVYYDALLRHDKDSAARQDGTTLYDPRLMRRRSARSRTRSPHTPVADSRDAALLTSLIDDLQHCVNSALHSSLNDNASPHE